MATIYLQHPKHGVKIATMEMEAQYDEAHGWVRFDPEEHTADEPEAAEPQPKIEPELDPLIADEEPANVLVEPRRRGRPRLAKSE